MAFAPGFDTREYFRQRSRAKGIPELNFHDFTRPHHVALGRELSAMMELLAMPAMKAADDGTRCKCGCGAEHRNRVSRVINRTTDYGTPAREVWWYASEPHKRAHIAKVRIAMFSANQMCDETIAEGPGASYYHLPEEQAMTNRPRYCSAHCANYVRRCNYITDKTNTVHIVEGTMRVNGASHA